MYVTLLLNSLLDEPFHARELDVGEKSYLGIALMVC